MTRLFRNKPECMGMIAAMAVGLGRVHGFLTASDTVEAGSGRQSGLDRHVPSAVWKGLFEKRVGAGR